MEYWLTNHQRWLLAACLAGHHHVPHLPITRLEEFKRGQSDHIRFGELAWIADEIPGLIEVLRQAEEVAIEA